MYTTNQDIANAREVKVIPDPDFVEHEYAGFASTGLADEPPAAEVANALADASDAQQAEIESLKSDVKNWKQQALQLATAWADLRADQRELEQQLAERPLSIEEAHAIAKADLPVGIYHLMESSGGYADSISRPERSMDRITRHCTLTDHQSRRTWTGPNWTDVLNQARSELCQQADEQEDAGAADHIHAENLGAAVCRSGSSTEGGAS